MDFSALSQLGLPGWAISVAALVFILERVGVFAKLYELAHGQQDHQNKMSEQRENYRNLQDSWQNERFADFLANSIDFLQVQVMKRLDKFDERLDQHDRTTTQTKDVLTTIYRELSHLQEIVSGRLDEAEKIATRNGTGD